jgi:Transposase IS4
MDFKFDELLLPKEERKENFEDCIVKDLLRPLPIYSPIRILPREGKPQNIDLNRHWNPLAIFQLFFTWEIMELICQQTNSYAYRTQTLGPRPRNPWKALTVIELYHFFGILLTIALWKLPPRVYLWSKQGPLSGLPISKNRFEQILKFLHFKDRGPTPQKGRPWWEKLDPILPMLRSKCQYYWSPGSNLTVDEVMLKFEGRSSQKTTIPGKPIPVGFKLFALADAGYILNWECTKPGLAEGVYEACRKIFFRVPGIPGETALNPTQSVVARLVKYLDIFIQSGHSFQLFLDNLFVSWKSCYYLKEQGIALTGPVRKGASGYPPRLLKLKLLNRALEWGHLEGSIIRGVACWLWQDANAVMGIYLLLLF